MIDQERYLQVKTDLENEIQETKDLLQNTRIDIEKLIIENEIFNRCIQAHYKIEQYERKIEWNKDKIIRLESNITEYIETAEELEIELTNLEIIIRECFK